MEDTQVMDLDCTFDHENDSDDEKTSTIVGWIEMQNKRHELKEGELKIGRDPSTCKIVIDNEKTLSKEHALLEIGKTYALLMDLGSRNKTKIDKMMLKPHIRYALQGGEKIKFGAVAGKYIVNKQARDSDSDTCSESVLLTPSKKTESECDKSNESSIISPTPQISTKSIASISKGNATKSSEAHCSKDRSIIISPTPQASAKNNLSRNEGPSSDRSLDFIPETPANNSSFLGSHTVSFATQSTPFTSYARAGLKGFTSPAFLSPISNINADISKEPLEGSPSLEKSEKDGPFIAKLDENSVNEEKDGYNTDESTDVEDFFADEHEHKRKSASDDDICALPTQPFRRENFDTKKDAREGPSHIDASKDDSNIDNDDTQEILAAFGENEGEAHGNDSTQDVLDAFEENTQRPFVGDIAEMATQQFDKTSSGTLFRKPFATPALKAKPKSSKVAWGKEENLDIFDAPTQIFNAGSPGNKSDSESSDGEDIFNMPTQKYSDISHERDKIKEDIFDAPTQAFEAPTQVSEAPTQIFEAPTQVCEAPTQIFEAPQVCESPTQIFEALTQVYEAPTQAFNASTKTPDVPTQICEAPTQIYDAFAEAYDAPTQVPDTTIRVDSPKRREATTDIYEAPTQRFDSHDDNGTPNNQSIDSNTQGIKSNTNISNFGSKVKDESVSDPRAKLIGSSNDNATKLLNNKSGESDYNDHDNTIPFSTDDDFDSTQKVESDVEEENTDNLSTVPISCVLDKIKTQVSSHANESSDSEDDTDSNASETLLQKGDGEDEFLEKTQKFSYSMITSETVMPSGVDNKIKDISKGDEAQGSDSEDNESCASDTLLQINDEENEKSSKIEVVVDYNSDSSTDVEGDETIPFNKSILTKEGTDKSALSKESAVKSLEDTALSIENRACDVSSATVDTTATNNTEVNDLSKLELTGDSITLPVKEVFDEKSAGIEAKEAEKLDKETHGLTYDTECDTSEFGYSCFLIDSSLLPSDDSRSSLDNTPIKISKSKEGKNVITPSRQRLLIADESMEVEEMDPSNFDISTKSQALFDLTSDDDDEEGVEEGKSCVTDSSFSGKKEIGFNDITVVASTPVVKIQNAENKESTKPTYSSSVKKLTVDHLTEKQMRAGQKQGNSIIELPDLNPESQNSSEIDVDNTDSQKSVKGIRLSRRNRGNKSNEESRIQDKSANMSVNKSKTLPETKVSPNIKESAVIQSEKRTRTSQKVDATLESEGIDSSRNKRRRTGADSNSSNTELLGDKKIQSPAKSLGRKRKSVSPASEKKIKNSRENLNLKEKNILPQTKMTPDRQLKSDDEVSNIEESKLLNILPDEKPICNKPFQKPTSPVISEIEDAPQISVQAKRRGRTSVAPSKYSRSGTTLTQTQSNITADEKPICNKPFQKPASPALAEIRDASGMTSDKQLKLDSEISGIKRLSKNKLEISSTKDGISDEKPICNKPFQKPASPVSAKIGDTSKISVRTTRRGRASAAPSRYSPSKTALPQTLGKRSRGTSDTEGDQEAKKSKVDITIEKRNKQEDKSISLDTSQVTHIDDKKKEKISVTREKAEKDDVSKNKNTTIRNSTQSDILTPKESDVSKSGSRTRSKVTGAKSSGTSLSPSTEIQRVTRHSQNVDVSSKEVPKVSKSAVTGKRKAAEEDKVNMSMRTSRSVKYSKDEDTVEENSEVIIDSEDKTDLKSINKESKMTRTKGKKSTEVILSTIIEDKENSEASNSKPVRGGTRSARSIKGKENIEEKSVSEKIVSKETKLINSQSMESISTRTRPSKSKIFENEDDSPLLGNDTKSNAMEISVASATSETKETNITITGKRKIRDGTAVVTKVSDEDSTKRKASNSTSKSCKSIAKPVVEESDKFVSRASSRHSQRKFEDGDSMKDECLSICSFSNISNESDNKKPVRKGRGRPSVIQPPPAVRQSTRGGKKLVAVENELEMSIISEDSSTGDSVKTFTRRGSRAVKPKQSISPTRSTRSRRSRGCSPSFSNEEMLWSPAQRQSMASKQPRVLFTTFKDSKDEKVVIDAGGKIAESASECTVLVTNAVKRTCKLLACVGKGIPIVSPDWISATKRAKNFVDPWEFIISDTESEEKFGFSLRNSLLAAAKRKLLSGYSIYVTDSVKPSPDDMREIIECAGGEYLDSAPKISTAKVLVVSCEEDKKLWKAFKNLGLTAVNKEFILTGLLRQKIMLNEYKIIL